MYYIHNSGKISKKFLKIPSPRVHAINEYIWAGIRNCIDLMRIWVQHFFLNADPNKNKFCSKVAIYFSLGLHRGRSKLQEKPSALKR